MIRFIVKRDGRKVSFNEDKISNAIRKALISAHPDDKSTSQYEEDLVEKLTRRVVSDIEKQAAQNFIQETILGKPFSHLGCFLRGIFITVAPGGESQLAYPWKKRS